MSEKLIKIYHTKTQEEYDYLMGELEKEGHIWWKQGDIRYHPTDIDNYYVFGEDTCIIVNPLDEEIDFCSISVAESEYNIDIEPVVMENPETKYTVVVPNGDVFQKQSIDTEPTQPTTNNVEKPSHYFGIYGLEVEKVLRNFIPRYENGYTAHRVGSAIEYLLRAPLKNGIEDIKKAHRNLGMLLEELGEDETI